MPLIPFIPATASNGVTVCTDLRTSFSGDSLVQTPPATRHIDGAWTPLLTLDREGNSLLVTQGCQVGLLTDSAVTLLGTASSPVTCALSDTSALITVMTQTGPEYLALSGEKYIWLGAKPTFPEVRFSAEMRGTISGIVPSHTFTSVNLADETPSIGYDEVAEYSTLLMNTYSDLSAMATAGRVWLQPVMVRAYYMDSSGRVIHPCAPVIIGPPQGWQGIETVTTGLTRHSDTSVTVNEWQMSLQTYVVNMQAHFDSIPDPWRRMVARIVVCISPQLHPFGYSESTTMAWRVNNHRGANPTLTLALPGATANFVSLDHLRLSEVADMTARILSSLPNEDFYGCFLDGRHTLTPLYSTTPHQERTQLEISLKKTRKVTVDMRMAELCSPHRFSASCGEHTGVWQIWGNITPHLYSGLRPCDFGVSDDDVADTGGLSVDVIDTDGERHILSAHSSMPQLISPLLLYPHTGATSLTLSMTNSDGATLRCEFELCPVPGTSWSVALNSNLAAISPDTFPRNSSDVTMLPPSDSGAMLPREDTVTVTTRLSWTTPLSHTTCDYGSVTALSPCHRAGTISDTGKVRACLFTTSGIYVTAINSRGVIESPHRIDMRPIISPRHVAYTPDGVYAATASELVRVRGNSSVTMLRDFHPEAIAWHPACNELWYTDSLGNLHLLSLPALRDSILTMPYNPVTLTAIGSQLWITGTDILTKAPDGTTPVPDDSPVEWCGRYCFTGHELPRRLTVDMFAEYFTGNIELSIDWGGTAFPVLTLAIDGPVEAPIVQPLFLPHNPWGRLLTRPYFTLRIQGTATRLRLHSFLFE